MRSRGHIAGLGLAVAIAACGDDLPPGVYQCVWEGDERPDYLYELGCPADFEWVKSPPLTPIFGETDSVKLIIDLLDNSTVTFTDGIRWPLHFDFLVEKRAYCENHGFEIDHPPDPADDAYQACRSAFNQNEYFSTDRQYLMATIEHYRALDLYTLEFAPGDQITTEQILHAFRTVVQKVWNGGDLKFRPSSVLQEERTRSLADEIPMVSYEDVFAGQTYQPLNPEVSFGYLRHLNGDEVLEQATPRDIVLTDTVPNDIAVVAGLITGEFQAPLSHVNVLSHNRGTPNMALRNAAEDSRVKPLIDQLVRLEVGLQDFSLEPASLEDAEAYWAASRPAEPAVPDFDLSVDDLVDLRDVHARHPGEVGESELDWIAAIGAKATNFGELMKIDGLPMVDEAFAIPVFFYRSFLEENGLDVEIDEMLEDVRFQTDLAYRQERLTALRDRILQGTVSADLEALLTAKLEADFPGTRMRFRSSSNAEDLQGFNGAGLYGSSSGELDLGIDDVTSAIRETWSTLWNDRAFEERDYYRIDHRSTMMGVLCHRAFPDEISNGVAITRNPFRENSRAYYVNAQAGEVSVVFSEAIPEQFLYYAFEPPEIEYLSRSSITNGEPVLSADQITTLIGALRAVHTHFYQFYGVGAPQGSYAMDIEWKFDAGGLLYIKQARPYLEISR